MGDGKPLLPSCPFLLKDGGAVLAVAATPSKQLWPELGPSSARAPHRPTSLLCVRVSVLFPVFSFPLEEIL